MSLRSEFINRLGAEGDMIKQVGDSNYILEVKFFSMASHLTAWEENENDTRGWTPRYKLDIHENNDENQYITAKTTYNRINSVSSMKEELEDNEELQGYDPEIPIE